MYNLNSTKILLHYSYYTSYKKKTKMIIMNDVIINNE